MKRFAVHRLIWDFEKEERWLNEMAAKGINFIDFTFARYLFEKGKPGEYIYRTELLPHPVSHPESQAYVEFMESVGVELMGKWMNWAIFRKKASDGPFEIFSDYASKIIHYRRVYSLFGILGIVNLLAFAYNIVFGFYAGYKYNNNYLAYIFPLVLINGALGVGLCCLAANYLGKVRRLKKEKQLHE